MIALVLLIGALLLQTPQPVRVIGEVVAMDADAKLMSVKSDTGDVFTLVFDEETKYLRVPPGEKTLDKAVPTTLTEVGRGDRVYARGVPMPDGKTVPIRQLVLMAKAAIETRHQQERDEWRRRGVLGTITELRPAKREIVLQARGRDAAQPLVVSVSDDTRFRRYAPDSVKFSDAKTSSFSELRMGDQLRALGQRGAEGAPYKAEQVVSGAFSTIGGTVTAVGADGAEIKITTFPDRKVMTVLLNKDSVLRRFPKEFASMMAQRMAGGPGGGEPRPAGSGAPAPGALAQAAPAGQPGMAPQGGPPRRGPGGPGGLGGPGGAGGGGEDLLDRLPPLTIAELKPGDAIMVASTTGKDPSKITAIAVVSGVEPFLVAGRQQGMQRGAGPGQPQSLGLPGGSLDMGIGLP